MMWAAAVHGISRGDAVVLGWFKSGLGDGDAGPRPGKHESEGCPGTSASGASAGEHCVIGPQHICRTLASAAMASVSSADVDDARFGTPQSGRDEPKSMSDTGGGGPASPVWGAKAVVGKPPADAAAARRSDEAR